MSETETTFRLTPESTLHDKGEECGACWTHYPKPHKCGGLMHAEFGDYTGPEYDYYLLSKCEKCGEAE